MKHLRFLVMAALVAMPLLACDDDEGGTVTPDVGTISGSVTAEGAGVAGVSVTLVGATSQSATTDASGAYTFASVEAGSYGVAISDFPADVSFSTVSKTTSITTSGQVATVDFSGSYIRTASISGSVSADGAGLPAVAVTMTGPEGAKNAVTDAAGNYSTSGLRSGDYTVTIEVPAGYIFANNSFDVSVGVGQATNVSFVGEAEITIDPVTASVVIESVKDDDGDFEDPTDIDGDIYVTLGIDPGENKLERVCVLLDGVVIPNGCQTLSSATEGEMLQGTLNPTFPILTDNFDEVTGAPDYFNGDHELSAQLDLRGAIQANVVTSMMLTFDNSDRVLSYLTSEFSEVGGGSSWVGGVQTVELLPTLYSGGELEELEVRFYFEDWGNEYFDVDGPFPQTIVFDPNTIDDDWDDSNWDFTTGDDLNSFFEVRQGIYSDGSNEGFYDYAFINGTDNQYTNFDFEAPYWTGDLLLTDQVDDIDVACCSNNWVGPDYMPDDGLGATPDDDGIGVEMYQFTIVTDLGTDDEAVVATIASDGTIADAALAQSLTNDEFYLCADAVDFFGNASDICLSGAGNNPLETFGYDDTGPSGQTVTAQPPDMVIYNIADALVGDDLGGLNLGASEDRSGFSAVPFRGYIQWWDADDTEYLVAQDTDDGGAVNLELPIESCTVAGAMPCYPDWDFLDGVFYVTGAMNNQAGVQFDEMVEGWVFNDQTPPEVNANVSVPNFIFLGQPASFSVPVEDALHLGSTAFGFQLTGLADIWFPLGGNVPNSAGDMDPWDGNFPTEETASITIDPAIMGVQLLSGGAPLRYDAVRAIHTDAAGNTSGVSSNNILATSFDSAPTAFDLGDITAFGTTEPSAAVFLCNAQGEDECDDDLDEYPEIDLEIVAEGAAGTFANPFLTGELYIYLRTDDDASGTVSAGDQLFLIDILDAGAAVITDEGAGGSRFYTWEYTLTGAQVAQFADGTDVTVHVMGLKYDTGTALLDDTGNANITIIDHM